ncbi:MAG: hypothetical protein WC683_01760 [bacterium]
MKVRRWVTIDHEVEVEVGPEDVAQILAEPGAREAPARMAVHAIQVLRAVAPAALNTSERRTIAGALREQADRFEQEG